MDAGHEGGPGPGPGPGRGGRGRGRGRGGRGRSDGPGRGGGRGRRPDPTPCPLGVDEDGFLKIKITCLIMRDFAGAVIGRGGEHVTDIRKESGALVHVCKADFETGIQGVDLYGTIDQVTKAHAKLTTILAANAEEWCEDKNWGARVRVQLLPDVASVVIGKKGTTVQRISKESGAIVRVGNEVDSANLQLCQIFGNNSEAAAAVVLLMECLREYNPAKSRTIPRLKELWESRRHSEYYPPPDGNYPGAGGPSPSRDRYGGSNRYEPYPRRMPPGSDAYPSQGGEVMSQQPVVVMPNGVQVPNIPGPMPTVLIQNTDGTLVQAQVMTQAGDHTGARYQVQPATQAQGAVQVLKSHYGVGQPLSVSATAPVAPTQQPGMGGPPPGQVLVQGPNGMMYAAQAPPAVAGAPAGADQGQQAYGTSQYQVQAAGGMQGAQQVADPMAYSKLASYGQQGQAKATTGAAQQYPAQQMYSAQAGYAQQTGYAATPGTNHAQYSAPGQYMATGSGGK